MNQIRFSLLVAATLIFLVRNGAGSLSQKHQNCIHTCDAQFVMKAPVPVCGTDGLTYKDPCYLNCQQKEEAGLKEKSKGACPKPPASACDCGNGGDVVCGSDREQYSACEARCKSITIEHKGPCGQDFEK